MRKCLIANKNNWDDFGPSSLMHGPSSLLHILCDFCSVGPSSLGLGRVLWAEYSQGPTSLGPSSLRGRVLWHPQRIYEFLDGKIMIVPLDPPGPNILKCFVCPGSSGVTHTRSTQVLENVAEYSSTNFVPKYSPTFCEEI